VAIVLAPERQSERPSRAGSLALVGGLPCLDFTNTASGRGSEHAQDHLKRYEHLLAWAGHTGLLDGQQIETLAAASKRRPRAAQRTLNRAAGLREALFRLFGAVIAGKPAPADFLRALDAVLGEGMARASIVPTGGRFLWTWEGAATAELDSILWPIARSAAELLTGPDLARIKRCQGLHCGWTFLDRSRNGRRRWCEMEVCGSRAKMRRYHQRRRAANMDREAVPG
jgi:predicted RNA-binding Zn ribbon-like protein